MWRKDRRQRGFCNAAQAAICFGWHFRICHKISIATKCTMTHPQHARNTSTAGCTACRSAFLALKRTRSKCCSKNGLVLDVRCKVKYVQTTVGTVRGCLLIWTVQVT